jgi:hypothetical protein
VARMPQPVRSVTVPSNNIAVVHSVEWLSLP